MHKQEVPAVFSAVAGACLWGVVWYPINLLAELGVSGLWTTFLVFALISTAALPFLVICYRRGNCPLRRGPAMIIIVFGGLTNLLFFLALANTSVVRALMFFYLSPIWNLISGRIVKGFPMTVRKVMVIVISLAGAGILLGLHHLAVPSWNRGDTYALLSGLCFAVSVIGLQLSSPAPSWALTVIHWFGAAFLALLGIMVLSPPAPSLDNINLWLPLLVLFAFCNQAAASLFILYSLTKLESYRVNILMLLEIIVGTVTYALWSSETIAFHEFIGISCILIASLLDNLRNNQGTGKLTIASRIEEMTKS